MAKVESIRPYLEPIRKSVTVRRTPQEAFEIFTERFGAWWPRERFSVHQRDALRCGLEPRLGGQVFEIARNGTREVWGTILTWDPPRRFAMSWHPGGDPAAATEVELTFVALPDGTRVELEHRNWTQLGARAEESRRSYDGGWAHVFERCYQEACR
jgi:uncharacterized protein YndB with AHSA1/START domain